MINIFRNCKKNESVLNFVIITVSSHSHETLASRLTNKVSPTNFSFSTCQMSWRFVVYQSTTVEAKNCFRKFEWHVPKRPTRDRNPKLTLLQGSSWTYFRRHRSPKVTLGDKMIHFITGFKQRGDDDEKLRCVTWLQPVAMVDHLKVTWTSAVGARVWNMK